MTEQYQLKLDTCLHQLHNFLNYYHGKLWLPYN